MEDKDKEKLENKENEIDERKELYHVFEKDKWYTKVLDFLGLLETVDDNPDAQKIESIKNKNFFKGFFTALILCFVVFCGTQFKFWFNPLENLKSIENKLTEINYYIDKYFLYEKDPKEIEDFIAAGMMCGLNDKYAAYYSEEDFKKLLEQETGEYYGVGIVVAKNLDDGLLTVTKIYESSDAMNTTLAIGDKILGVDDIDVTTYDSDEIVSLVKGAAGTKVKLTVLKENNSIEDIEIMRKQIEMEYVTGRMLDNEIAYCYIDSFDGKASEQLAKLQNEFVKQDAKGLIIDLRNNPGGSLTQLMRIANIFLDNKVVTTFKYKFKDDVVYTTTDGAWDIPVVILVNGYSASAAEAFTGAMQDYEKAKVVGTQTYGKGIVQEIYKLTDGSAIKFTIADYYTPNDVNITGKGITPDVVVEYDSKKEDNQLDEALKVIKDMIK